MPISEPATLSPIEWVALSIVGREAAKVRERVEPCSRKTVDLLLRIRGTVSVGADSEATVQRGPSAEDVLAWVLKELTEEQGIPLTDDLGYLTADALCEKLTECAGKGLPEIEEGYAAKAKALIQSLSQKCVQPRRGSTRGSFEVGLVEQSRLSQPVALSVQKFTRAIVLEDTGEETRAGGRP